MLLCMEEMRAGGEPREELRRHYWDMTENDFWGGAECKNAFLMENGEVVGIPRLGSAGWKRGGVLEKEETKEEEEKLEGQVDGMQ